jgi:exonuclease SbcD
MSELRGCFTELTDPIYYENKDFREHYLRIILTDEEDIPEAMARLRQIYPRVLSLDYDNTRTRQNQAVTGATDADRRSAFELFADFFELQNNMPMSEEQSKYMAQLIERIEEEMA